MTPIAPVLPPAALAPADPQARLSSVGTQPPGAPPSLGAEAVTAIEATKPVTPRDPGREAAQQASPRIDPLEPPSDPPPVKGLGIPALHTAKVGDQDILDDPPLSQTAPERGGFQTALAQTDGARDPSYDLRR